MLANLNTYRAFRTCLEGGDGALIYTSVCVIGDGLNTRAAEDPW